MAMLLKNLCVDAHKKGEVNGASVLRLAAEITGIKRNGQSKIRYVAVATSETKLVDASSVKSAETFVKSKDTEIVAAAAFNQEVGGRRATNKFFLTRDFVAAAIPVIDETFTGEKSTDEKPAAVVPADKPGEKVPAKVKA